MGKASRRKKINRQHRAPIPFVSRPFEGLDQEVQLVAMREIIPCATLPARTTAEHGDVAFEFVTLLPDGVGALVRGDGQILVGLQTRTNSGDLSHDLAGSLLAAIKAKNTGQSGTVGFDVRDPAPRLQDLIVSAETPMDLREDFSFWFDAEELADTDRQAALEQNREDMVPTEAVPGTDGMFWCAMNNNFVRYVTDIDEDDLFTALARLQAGGKAKLGEKSQFVGAFRSCGIAIPVFQVDPELTAAQLAEPAELLVADLQAALADSSPLTEDEKRSRAGLISRQVTVR